MDTADSLSGPFEGFHLAQVNIGRLVAPLDDPAVADFTKNLGRINTQGKGMPGFVWILEGEAPAFVKSEGPLYFGGPVWRIELTSPVWPKATSPLAR